MLSEYTVLCDFDGTITNRDVASSIIIEFSTGDWKSIEDRYIKGIITSRQELEEQFSHVDVPEEIILRYIDNNIHIDPAFMYFLNFCRMNDISLTIVSEGLDFYIDHMLLGKGQNIPVRANKAIIPGSEVIGRSDGGKGNDGANGGNGSENNEGIQIRFFTPLEDDDCGKCGNCKTGFLEEQKEAGKTVIYIGDGRSDFCPAKKADIVFAKGHLARHLQSNNIEHNPFISFSDIVAAMEEFI